MFINYSITFIVPSKNEELKIANVIDKIVRCSLLWRQTYVVVIDDGSSDRTYETALLSLSKTSLNYKLIRNEFSKNLGGVFKQGLELAQTDYVMVIQGQDDIKYDEIQKIFAAKLSHNEDMIIPIQSNWQQRPFIRRTLSRLFVFILNAIFSLRINYYNHSVLMKVKDAKSVDIYTNSYCYQAELIIRLILSGKSYYEVPVIDQFNHKSQTSAFKLKNILGVGMFLFKMITLRLLK